MPSAVRARLSGAGLFDSKARPGVSRRACNARLVITIEIWIGASGGCSVADETEGTSDRPENDPRWARVASRDRTADGAFFYSVRTTGVYCRPSCAARLANPKNVRFHADLRPPRPRAFVLASAASPTSQSREEQYAAKIAAACRAIEAAEDAPSLAELAQAAGHQHVPFSPRFQDRDRRHPEGIRHGAPGKPGARRAFAQRHVTEAIYDAGFNSNSRFYEKSEGMLGMTPREFRAGGANTEIRFAVGECSLGAILVAASQKGICAILMGDDPDALVRNLQDRFPRAKLIGGDAEFEKLVAQVVGFVEAPAIGLDLPLDLRGTAFQQRVWQALREIPVGQTASYAEIARRIGSPKAVRGVAQACGANPVAVAIPCHRVVRSDGALSGYRWGVERKRALLDRENAA